MYAVGKATAAGRRAMNNFEPEFFAAGAPFDACVVNADAPLLANVKAENLAGSIIYTADVSQIYGTFVNGKLVQKEENYQRLKRDFINCVRQFR